MRPDSKTRQVIIIVMRCITRACGAGYHLGSGPTRVRARSAIRLWRFQRSTAAATTRLPKNSISVSCNTNVIPCKSGFCIFYTEQCFISRTTENVLCTSVNSVTYVSFKIRRCIKVRTLLKISIYM